MYSPQVVGSRLIGVQMYRHQASWVNRVYFIKSWYNTWLDRLINLILKRDKKENETRKPDDGFTKEESGVSGQGDDSTRKDKKGSKKKTKKEGYVSSTP